MKNKFKLVLIFLLQFYVNNSSVIAQLTENEKNNLIKEITDSLKARQSKIQVLDDLKISGYVETYYCYDFASLENHTRPNFVYSFNRSREINLNLGFVKLAYNTDKVRANIGLMAGTYSNANLILEPGLLKNIFESNAGFKIAKNKNLWLDAGIFASHIGFESAIGKDCWNLTRSLLADNSPYFESGIKVSYTSKNEKWFVSGLILNGWQRIQRQNANNLPAFGHQITFKPNSKITLNSSSFIGSETPDSIRQMRYFHNFYGIFQIHEKWGLTFGFDIGAQQKSKASSDYNSWFSPVLIAKFTPNSKFAYSSRIELYKDKTGVIIATNSPNGFETYGFSLNVDYFILPNAILRFEGRGLNSKDKIFVLNKKLSNQNYFITTSFCVSF